MNEPLIVTTLKKDEPLLKSILQQLDIGVMMIWTTLIFVKELIDNGFPDGDYIINGLAKLYFEDPSEAANQEKFNLKATSGFTGIKAM